MRHGHIPRQKLGPLDQVYHRLGWLQTSTRLGTFLFESLKPNIQKTPYAKTYGVFYGEPGASSTRAGTNVHWTFFTPAFRILLTKA